MTVQAEMFSKPVPRPGACARAPGLRHSVWTLFEEGMQLSSNAVAKILAADLGLVQRRVYDLVTDGLLEDSELKERSHGARGATVWRRKAMGTVSIESLVKNGWVTTKDDRTAVRALEQYVERMKEIQRDPQPRLRIEQYDRFFKLAQSIDRAVNGLTFNGYRVLGGGMST